MTQHTSKPVKAAVPRRPLSPRLFEWAGVVLFGVGTLLWVVPVNVDVPPREVRAMDATAAAPAPSPRDVRDALVRDNLFSATRRAPTQRFVVPGQEGVSPASAMDAVQPAAAVDDVQLFGVVMVNGARRALLQVGSAEAGAAEAGGAETGNAEVVPRLVQVGDRAGAYRVRRIEADRVELSSGSGTRIVRLQRRPVSDSSGAVP